MTERRPTNTTHIIFGNGTPHQPDFPGVDPEEWVYNGDTRSYEPRHPDQNGFHHDGVNGVGVNTGMLTDIRNEV